MRVVFFMRSTIYVRNFESSLRLLASRGHEVCIVADPHHLEESNELLRNLCVECPDLTHVLPPVVPFDAWSFLGNELRRGRDYLRYLGPDFVSAAKLKARAERSAPGFVLALMKRRFWRAAPARRVLSALLHIGDRAMPRSAAVDAFVRELRPDLVVVTPLVEPGAPQAQYLRSARAIGVPTALCVYSWDNLTNKGLIHDPLDLVTVWNEPMKAEAIAFHGVPAHRVVVTGAPSYDHWFSWSSGQSRKQFCACVGLPADKPYLLYLCSSKFIAPNEPAFVRRWASALRAGPPALAGVGILVRPHPQNADSWQDVDLSDLGVAVWPRHGANPVESSSRADYFDSIHHSTAVVGVNTSAQIESAIVGRGVYPVLDPDFRDTQEGTLHFRHLRTVNGGLLHVARDFAEHQAQLEQALAGPVDDRCRRFVEAFVRPHGLEVEATPRLVDALEAVAAPTARRLGRAPWWAPIVRTVLAPVANRLARTTEARAAKTRLRERIRSRGKEELVTRRIARQRAKAEEDEQLRRQAQQEAADVVTQELEQAALFQRYKDLRVWASGLQPSSQLSGEEAAYLSALERFWNATPSDITELRRTCASTMGVREADYREELPGLKAGLRARLATLRKSAPDLFVPEPNQWGGFGFWSRLTGALYNQDTLRFYEAMVAMRDAAILSRLDQTGQRRVVWEIGGRWGGFAHQLKTVCPNVTYLITGHPIEILVSSVYLSAIRPDARCRQFLPTEAERFWDDWEDVDFAFAPESAVAELSVPRLDVVVDLGALGLMSAERRAAHVRRAFELGAPFIHAMVPVRCDPDAAHCVQQTLDRWFWLHPVPHRAEGHRLPGQVGPPFLPDHGYDHVAGWRRLRA